MISKSEASVRDLVEKLSELPPEEAKQMTAERLKDNPKLRAIVDKRVELRNHRKANPLNPPPTQAERDAAWETRKAMKAAAKNGIKTSTKNSEAVAQFNNLVDKLSQLPLEEAKQMTAEQLKDNPKLRALVDRRVQINQSLRDYVPPTQAERDAAWETRKALKAEKAARLKEEADAKHRAERAAKVARGASRRAEYLATMNAAAKNAKDNPSPVEQRDGETPMLKISLPPEIVAALKARKAQS